MNTMTNMKHQLTIEITRYSTTGLAHYDAQVWFSVDITSGLFQEDNESTKASQEARESLRKTVESLISSTEKLKSAKPRTSGKFCLLEALQPGSCGRCW